MGVGEIETVEFIIDILDVINEMVGGGSEKPLLLIL